MKYIALIILLSIIKINSSDLYPDYDKVFDCKDYNAYIRGN